MSTDTIKMPAQVAPGTRASIQRTLIRLLRHLALPPGGILLGAALSALAWALPPLSSAGKGFVASSPTPGELCRTIAAYAVIALIAGIGYVLGNVLSRRLPTLAEHRASDLRNTEVWTALIFLSSVGVLIAGMIVLRAMGISACVRTLMTFNANAFKFALYENYSAGLLSLRYLSILAAAIAI